MNQCCLLWCKCQKSLFLCLKGSQKLPPSWWFHIQFLLEPNLISISWPFKYMITLRRNTVQKINFLKVKLAPEIQISENWVMAGNLKLVKKWGLSSFKFRTQKVRYATMCTYTENRYIGGGFKVRDVLWSDTTIEREAEFLKRFFRLLGFYLIIAVPVASLYSLDSIHVSIAVWKPINPYHFRICATVKQLLRQRATS